MAFIRVSSVSDLPPGTVTEVMARGNPIALCNVGGRIRALLGVCPHSGGPLGQGVLNGENIVCPWHAWEFDCMTGRNDYDPDTRVPTWAVRIEGDDILIDPDA